MKVLVCGGRDYTNADNVSKTLNWIVPLIKCVVHGGARGADSLAGEWAKANGVEERIYLPDWTTHGRKAGILRNIKMLDSEIEGLDLVIAFPGGSGTAHMVSYAKKCGVAVLEVA